MVDVETPGLAVQGFGHGVADAGEADGVCARRAGRHGFEGGVAEAAFAFVEGASEGRFSGVEVGGEFEVEGFEGGGALVEEGLEDGGVQFGLEFGIACLAKGGNVKGIVSGCFRPLEHGMFGGYIDTRLSPLGEEDIEAVSPGLCCQA